MNQNTIIWFRRDLRLYDNAALFHALKDSNQVFPVFIFDIQILSKLKNKKEEAIRIKTHIKESSYICLDELGVPLTSVNLIIGYRIFLR